MSSRVLRVGLACTTPTAPLYRAFGWAFLLTSCFHHHLCSTSASSLIQDGIAGLQGQQCGLRRGPHQDSGGERCCTYILSKEQSSSTRFGDACLQFLEKFEAASRRQGTTALHPDDADDDALEEQLEHGLEGMDLDQEGDKMFKYKKQLVCRSLWKLLPFAVLICLQTQQRIANREQEKLVIALDDVKDVRSTRRLVAVPANPPSSTKIPLQTSSTASNPTQSDTSNSSALSLTL